MDIKSLDVESLGFKFFVDGLVTVINRRRDGESYPATWRRQRENSPKNPVFWRMLLRTIGKMLVKAFSTSLSVCEKLAIALLFYLPQVADEVIDFTEVSPLKVSRCEPIEGRSPPKRFIPIYKIEIGGYARSDSTSAPAI
ncbi:hypothetical protein [Microcoleus sp.]|uniref:hypothetical protein n=1 Tax=Microcoleus sp. TaxID=44472 RepID=UPI0035251DFC